LSRLVVAVLGYSARRPKVLHPVCAGRIARAQELAVADGTVILSGESELMRTAWTGPRVAFVCDPHARSTADNATNVAAAARDLGAEELVVVTSPWHRARAGILLRAALRGSGIRLRLASPSARAPFTLLARELACFGLLPLQLKRLRAARGKGS
jgi:DUF218 domain